MGVVTARVAFIKKIIQIQIDKTLTIYLRYRNMICVEEQENKSIDILKRDFREAFKSIFIKKDLTPEDIEKMVLDAFNTVPTGRPLVIHFRCLEKGIIEVPTESLCENPDCLSCRSFENTLIKLLNAPKDK